MKENDRNLRPPGRDDRQIVDYLLDRLSPNARDRFETEMMDDPCLFELVEASEEDLLLRYVRGAVPPGDRSRIEEVYSTPPRAARLAEARAMSAAMSEVLPVPVVRQSAWTRFWTPQVALRFAMAGVTIAALVVVFYIPRQDPQSRRAPESPVVVWRVVAGRVRSADATAPAVFTRPGTGVVRIELPGAACGDAGPCRVELIDADTDATRWGGVAARSSDGVWSADVPGDALVPGDHIVEVTAPTGARSSHQMRVQ